MNEVPFYVWARLVGVWLVLLGQLPWTPLIGGGWGQPGLRGWSGVAVFTVLGVVAIVFAKSPWLRRVYASLPGVRADGMR
ncbi:MAG: hypothetical protein AAGK09_00395 [Planctomycetota bacterium]